MELPPLLGFTVGVTAGRRADEQASLLARRGATVLIGPVIASTSHEGDPALAAATEALIAQRPDVVLLTTGVGTRAWFADADALGLGDGLRDALCGAEVLARGPKAAGAAVAAGLEVAWRAPGERSRDLLDHVAARPDCDGLRVAVQLHGHEAPWLADAVDGLGCDVVAVRSYRWSLPDDVGPALELIDAVCRGEVDAVTFTSAPAVDNFVQLATDAGLREPLLDALRNGVAPVCVGPVTAEALAGAGVTAVEPDRPRMVGMVAAVAEHLSAKQRTVTAGGVAVVISGSVAVVDGDHLPLSPRDRRLLDALVERPGVVLSKRELLQRAWPNEPADEHAVEVAIGRLRQRLGSAGAAIETVVRRGYRLAVSV